MIKVIKSETEYSQALKKADAYFENPPKTGTEEGDEFELLLLVIKEYEDKHYSIPTGDAIDVILMTMEEKGLKAKDMEPFMGKKSYVSQILNRKKPLTLEMVKNLHTAFHIPFKLLLT
jgi:HTH-type transcriptional regulator / antitoxin HigA